jgi:SAM-dependent methyltransferase
LPYKQYSEIKWWQHENARRIDWYEGRRAEFHGVPAPRPEDKVVGDDLGESALWTWLKLTQDTYPRRLALPTDHFRGKRVLDVGCGPLPLALAFTECEVYGLDQLIDHYAKVGYPLHKYPARMKYVLAGAERIPLPDHFVDAVISVNAIDHVDDFGAAAREIGRVLRPGGLLRMEVHYHAPNECEPWGLDDDIVLEHFGYLKIRKVQERAPTPHERLLADGEKLVVWTTG